MQPVVSHHARYFDPQNANWHPEDTYNITFLNSSEEFFQNKLQSEGCVLVNDIYQSLGMKRSSAGCVEGWVYDDRDKIKMMEFYHCLSMSGGGFIVDFPNTQVVSDFFDDEEPVPFRSPSPTRYRRVYGRRSYSGN